MSERTTIGGTVYETVGSSSSNLLLKCNGTARIQWGNKLIDLIKNGKIATGDSSTAIYTISDESEIKSDGIYIVNKDQSLQLWISKKGEQYNLTNTDLYISASTKQDLTVEQQQQAMENIGMYYNTFEDLQASEVQNGLGYIIDEKKLYTIKDGVISEFEAMLKTVTVEKEQQEGEIITSNVKIVLSVLDTEYVVVGSGQVLVKYPLRVSESAAIESENANDTRGYRLYVDSQGSHLDVDYINVRTGLPLTEYISVTYSEFMGKIGTAQLQAHQWYLIEDYKNPWKLPGDSDNRPILVRALTGSMLYPEGKLFKDQRVLITYDPYYQEEITGDDSTTIATRGRITRMQDSENNVANFDFLDYTDSSGNPFTTLYQSSGGSEFDSSIFPPGSFNNTLTVNDLYGTVLSGGVFGGSSVINFQFQNETSEENQTVEMYMYDNTIECNGLTLISTKHSFSNNNITLINSNVSLDEDSYPLLYNNTTDKKVYYEGNTLQIITSKDQTFFRGMIIMYNGQVAIPEGWAICDGNEHEYKGEYVTTPNLIGKFIKACAENSVGNTGGNTTITLEEKHLPQHSHPHNEHTHTISGLSGNIENSGDLTSNLNKSVVDFQTDTTSVISSISGIEEEVSIQTSEVVSQISKNSETAQAVGGDHTHNVSISGGVISNTTSTETSKSWANESINIEPNYYSLIFIMKL